MATLSRADVEHVAHLARLGLTDEELGRLEGQLNHILDQYTILATVPTDHIAPTAQTIELENILRDDVAQPSLPVDAVLQNAAKHDGASHRRPGDPRRRVTDLTRLRAHEMASRFRSGEVSSRELTEAHLDLAERQDRGLHAWLSIDRERALGEADAADARLAAARGEGMAAVDALHPLLGIPVALKDLVSVAGGQCTAGSRILEGYHAPYDAHITERLRDVGAVILGKTNMDEFAMGSSTEHSAFGPTANPWALDRVPGGSSGGSASAVAAFHAPLSIGTDTGGSIRQPAALTGIVGMKPTYGRVSRYGIVAFASSLDQIGPFARDARDAAALLHAVAGRDERDSTSAPEPVSDALLSLPARRRGGRGVAARQAARVCRASTSWPAWSRGSRRASARPSPRSRPPAPASRRCRCRTPSTASRRTTSSPRRRRRPTSPATTASATGRGWARGATSWATTWRRAGGGFGPEVKRRIMLGTYALSAGYYDAYYLKAQKVRTLIKGDFDALWAQGFDALVAPTSPTVAFRFGARLEDPVAMYLSDACTLPVNMAGLPGHLDPGRAVGRSARRAAVHRGAVVGARVVRAGARLRGDHRERPTGGRSSPPTSPRSTTRRRRHRAERMAAMAVVDR